MKTYETASLDSRLESGNVSVTNELQSSSNRPAGIPNSEETSTDWELSSSPYILERKLEQDELETRKIRASGIAGRLVVEKSIDLRHEKRSTEGSEGSFGRADKLRGSEERSAKKGENWSKENLKSEAEKAGGGEKPPGKPPTAEGADEHSELPEDWADRAREANLRIETVRKAAEAGYADPVDFLVKSRRVPHLVKQLESLGFDMSPPSEPSDKDSEVESLSDHPYWGLNRQGQHRTSEIATVTREVGEKRRKAKKRLKRVSPPIPGIRNLHQRTLARRMFKHHKKTRPKVNEKTKVPILYDDGLLGRGRKKKQTYRKHMQSVDKAIAVERGKLDPLTHHELKDLKTDRSRTAERILLLQSLREAILRGEITPEDFYDHSRFEKLVKRYEGKS